MKRVSVRGHVRVYPCTVYMRVRISVLCVSECMYGMCVLAVGNWPDCELRVRLPRRRYRIEKLRSGRAANCQLILLTDGLARSRSDYVM